MSELAPPLIEECVYDDVRRFATAGARERVAVTDTADTRWFRYEDIGCAGLLTLMNGGGRIKGVFIDPAFRGRGVGTALTEAVIRVAVAAKMPHLEAFALNPPWYLARGFSIMGKNSHGVARVVRRLA